MLFADMPDLPVAVTPIVQMQSTISFSAASTTPLSPDVKFELVLTPACQDVVSRIEYVTPGMPSAINNLSPLGAVYNHYDWQDGKHRYDKISVGVLSGPSHGKLVKFEDDVFGFYYESNIDEKSQPYRGADTIIFWVRIEDKYYKVVQNLAVGLGTGDRVPVCEGFNFPPVSLNTGANVFGKGKEKGAEPFNVGVRAIKAAPHPLPFGPADADGTTSGDCAKSAVQCSHSHHRNRCG